MISTPNRPKLLLGKILQAAEFLFIPEVVVKDRISGVLPTRPTDTEDDLSLDLIRQPTQPAPACLTPRPDIVQGDVRPRGPDSASDIVADSGRGDGIIVRNRGANRDTIAPMVVRHQRTR